MKEQSHKSEMGAALRGDFERLRARRGDDHVVPALPRPATATATAQAAREPAPCDPEVVAETPPVATREPKCERVQEPSGARPPSWLARLRGSS